MKVSVIVPVYNAGKYLKQCIDSLLSQTLDDIEIIAIDNHSSDDSLSILESYGERIKVIAQTETYSQAHSMIVGLAEASGDYVAECDSDDYVASNMYERLYNMASLHDCDVVACGWYDHTDTSDTERLLTPKIYCGNPLDDMRGIDLVGFIGYQPHIMSAIYRRSFLHDNDIWYRDGHNFEDTCLSFKIKTLGKPYAYIPECLYYYRTDNVSSGAHTIKDTYAICEQYDEIMRWNNTRNLDLDIVIGVLRYYSYRWSAHRLDAEQLEAFTAKASEDFNKDMVMPQLFLTKEDWDDYSRIKNSPPMSRNEAKA